MLKHAHHSSRRTHLHVFDDDVADPLHLPRRGVVDQPAQDLLQGPGIAVRRHQRIHFLVDLQALTSQHIGCGCTPDL